MQILRFIWLLDVYSASSAAFAEINNAEEMRVHVQQGEVVCRSIPVPSSTDRVIIRASVVGLTGNPNLFGGWEEHEIRDRVQNRLAPVSSGGYHVFSEYEDVPVGKSSYFLCVTTFSTQGSDFILTESITDATGWLVSPIAILESFPVVWRLDGKGHNYADFVLTLDPGNANDADRSLVVSVSPLYGELNVRVYECDKWTESLAVSAVKGPEIISVGLSEMVDKVCIRVHTEGEADDAVGEFALSASTNKYGPFLAQSVPISGSSAILKKFRLYVNPSTDVSVILRSSVRGAKLHAVTDSGENSASSDERGRLEIVKSLGKTELIYKIEILSETLSHFSITATAHGTVEELADGMTISEDVEGANRYRDFRIFVPSETSFLVIQADSSKDGSGLGLFASSVRTSHDPRGYKWNSMKGTNELVLSRQAIVSDDIDGIIDCRDCYIYISVKSCIVQDGLCSDSGGMSSFTLSAGSDTGVATLSEDKNSDAEPPIMECEQRCALEIEKDDPSEYIMLENTNSEFIAVEAGLGTSMFLRNHHSVVFPIAATREDKFKFVVPTSADLNAILRIKKLSESKSGSLSTTVCCAGDCQTVLDEGYLKLKSGENTIQVQSADGGEATYSIYPSFFSLVSNSLRVGFKPVSVLIPAGGKISWQVGFDADEEWLVATHTVNERVEMCLQDLDKSRCCAGPCSLAGFGRQELWVGNKNEVESLITLTTESLSPQCLKENEKLDISDRTSKIFKIKKWPSKIEADQSVVYMINSPEGAALLSPPVERDVGESGSVFARIEGGNSALLVSRHSLRVNEWQYNHKWLFWEKGGPVRVERCSDNSTDPIIVNSVLFSDKFFDIETKNSEINIVSSGPFRAGVVTGKRITVQLASDPAFLSLLENENGFEFLKFVAPHNAASSLYRALCYPNIEFVSQCVIEQSAQTIRGDPVACVADSECNAPIPANCPEKHTVSVTADKGPQYGVFSPLIRQDDVSFLAMQNQTSSSWVWLLLKIALGFFAYKFVSSPSARIVLRIFAFRIIDTLRGKPKFQQDMELGTGYRMMSVKDPMETGSRARPKAYGSEMFSRSVY